MKDKLLWLLILVTVLSPLWSDYPNDTLLEVIPFLRVTIFAAYFATRYSLREQIQMVAWVMGFAAIGSAVLAIAMPFYGVITNMEQLKHQGTWRGVFLHKTLLGTMMSIGVLSSLFCCVKKLKPYLINWLCLVFTVFLLVASTTRGALVFMLAVLLMIPFFRALRWNYKLAVPFFIVGLVSISSLLLLATNAESILMAMGRDTTIWGRTIYWPLMLDKALDRPWFGYGYNAFWIGGWKGETRAALIAQPCI